MSYKSIKNMKYLTIFLITFGLLVAAILSVVAQGNDVKPNNDDVNVDEENIRSPKEINNNTSSDIENYWTEEAMESAQPYTMTVDDADVLLPEKPDALDTTASEGSVPEVFAEEEVNGEENIQSPKETNHKTSAEVENYWTEEAMESAQPYTMTVDDADVLLPEEPDALDMTAPEGSVPEVFAEDEEMVPEE